MIDILKARNIEQLAHIQPALKYQEDNGIVVGKLIPGTVFLDGGDGTSSKRKYCPACRGEWKVEKEEYAYCSSCWLGGRK